MSKETFIAGFCKVANQHGVPPQQLAKFAGSLVGDTAGNLLWCMIPGGNAINLLGTSGGMLATGRDHDEDSGYWSVLPGVGAYRMANRARKVQEEEAEELKKNPGSNPDLHPNGSFFGDTFGGLTSTGLLTALGAGAGALAKGRRGALYGAGTGLGVAGAAMLGSAIAAAITKRRKKKDQLKADSGAGNVLAKFLVPGKATYDMWKRLGYTNQSTKERES